MTDLEARLRLLPSGAFTRALGLRLSEQSDRLAPTSVARGSRIGVIADTHCRRAQDLPDQVLQALADVDIIVHCGDIGTVDLLARLEAVAPVLAVRSEGDAPADGHRLFDGPRLLRAGSALLGVVAHVDENSVDFHSLFGTGVDAVLTGTTHVSQVRPIPGDGGRYVPLINPGSPTLPADGRPSVAIVDCRPNGVSARIVPTNE